MSDCSSMLVFCHKLFWGFLLRHCLSKLFFLYQKHCFSGLKITDFYFYGPDLILLPPISRLSFPLRLNAINCAHCSSITMHFRYTVKINSTTAKLGFKKGYVSIYWLISQLSIIQGIDRSSNCARKLKPSDVLSHS